MIDARKALQDLAAAPGEIVALPKSQMAALLTELVNRQERAVTRDLSIFAVAAIATGQPA